MQNTHTVYGNIGITYCTSEDSEISYSMHGHEMQKGDSNQNTKQLLLWSANDRSGDAMAAWIYSLWRQCYNQFKCDTN